MTRRTFAFLLLTFCLLTSSTAQGQGEQLEWMEATPIDADGYASVTMGGTWSDSCAPTDFSFNVGRDRVINVTATKIDREEFCLQVISPWSVTGKVGPLKGYEYLAIGLVRANGQVTRQELGSIWPERAAFDTLDSGAFFNYANDVSADGNVIAGHTEAGPLVDAGYVNQAIRWTKETDKQRLGFLPDGPFADGVGNSLAYGISADGNTLVGESTNGRKPHDQQWYTEGFRWTDETAMSYLSEDPIRSIATATSANGDVIVGRAIVEDRQAAFRWTADTGMTFPELNNGMNRGASDVSRDGNTIVGNTRTAVDDEGRSSPIFPFAWTVDGGSKKLWLPDPCPDCDLDAGIEFGAANAVSADGNFAVGFSQYTSIATPTFRIKHAVLWDTESGTPKTLPPLPNINKADRRAHALAMEAVDVSSDGSIVIGNAEIETEKRVDGEWQQAESLNEPFIWDEQRGTRWLREVLEKDAGLTPEILGEVTAISDDGTTIVGNAEFEGWRADLYHGFAAGDTDFSGSVDFKDFLVLSNHFGQSNQFWSTGDFTGDSKTGFDDFLELAANFGSSLPSEDVATTPEPNGAGLLAFGIVAVGCCRQRRQRKR